MESQEYGVPALASLLTVWVLEWSPTKSFYMSGSSYGESWKSQRSKAHSVSRYEAQASHPFLSPFPSPHFSPPLPVFMLEPMNMCLTFISSIQESNQFRKNPTHERKPCHVDIIMSLVSITSRLGDLTLMTSCSTWLSPAAQEVTLTWDIILGKRLYHNYQ